MRRVTCETCTERAGCRFLCKKADVWVEQDHIYLRERVMRASSHWNLIAATSQEPSSTALMPGSTAVDHRRRRIVHPELKDIDRQILYWRCLADLDVPGVAKRVNKKASYVNLRLVRLRKRFDTSNTSLEGQSGQKILVPVLDKGNDAGREK